jgi:hypothetical protein
VHVGAQEIADLGPFRHFTSWEQDLLVRRVVLALDEVDAGGREAADGEGREATQEIGLQRRSSQRTSKVAGFMARSG